MYEPRPEVPLPYDEAKRFWRQWHSDPYADRNLSNPWEAVHGMLVGRFGQHPIEAAYVARIALDSVIEEDYQQSA